MHVEHHDLHHEFPEMLDAINALRNDNPLFARLYLTYNRLTGKVEETSQAFSDLKTTLDKTESFSQPRRTKASGGGGDELLTDC